MIKILAVRRIMLTIGILSFFDFNEQLWIAGYFQQ